MYQNAIDGSKYNGFDPNGVFLESVKLGENVEVPDSSKDFMAYLILNQYFPEEVKLVDIDTLSEDPNDEATLFFQLLKERETIELDKYNLPLHTITPTTYGLPDKLPKDINLVIRTSELSRFINSLMEDPELLENPAIKKNKIRTSESSLIDSLGIMAIILSKEKSNLSRSNRPNASQIATAIEQRAAELGLPLEQISNLNKDVSTAVDTVLAKLPKTD